jgi:hypothetical protein
MLKAGEGLLIFRVISILQIIEKANMKKHLYLMTPSIWVCALIGCSSAHAAPLVTGENVHFVRCGSEQFGETQYADAGDDHWVYLVSNMAHGNAKVNGRDKGAIYLTNDEGAKVVLDLGKKVCSWTLGDNQRITKVVGVSTLWPQ